MERERQSDRREGGREGGREGEKEDVGRIWMSCANGAGLSLVLSGPTALGTARLPY